MKDKLFKLIAVVMSFVVLCSVTAVCPIAAGNMLTAVEHYAPELDGYEAYSFLVNKNNSIAFIATADEDFENEKYFYTTDGFSYTEIDFSEYASKCDAVILTSADCDGENFVFLFHCCNSDYIYDEEIGEYFEDYETVDSYFIITKDFKTFEKCKINVDADTTIYQGDYYSYLYSGLMMYMDGEWFFADGDYIVTNNEGNVKKGKGVYYTTKDFKTWEIGYTMEEVVWDVTDYSFMFYLYDGCIGYCSDYTDSGEYLLIDGKSYGPFSVCYEDAAFTFSNFIYIHGADCVLRVDTICSDEYMADETGEIHPDYKLFSINLSTCEEKLLGEGKEDFYYGLIYYNNRVYLNHFDWETAKNSMYEIDSDYKLTKINSAADFDENNFIYYLGSNLYGCGYDKINVYKGNLCDGYSVDLSKVNYKIEGNERVQLTFNENMMAFEINGKLVILETNSEAERAVIYEISGVDTRTVGDTNSDGVINSSDALNVLQKATGLIPEINSDAYVYDVDRSGSIQASDALRILQYATGLVGSIAK